MVDAVDGLIVLGFVVIVAVGFSVGVAKVLSAIVASYVASFVSAALYRPVATEVARAVPGVGRQTGELIVFLLVFVVFAAVSTVVVSGWVGRVPLPRRVALLDDVGGAVVGGVVSALAMTVVALAPGITSQAASDSAAVAAGDPVTGLLRGQIGTSVLIPRFLRLAPLVGDALAPRFPSGLPPIPRVE